MSLYKVPRGRVCVAQSVSGSILGILLGIYLTAHSRHADDGAQCFVTRDLSQLENTASGWSLYEKVGGVIIDLSISLVSILPLPIRVSEA